VGGNPVLHRVPGRPSVVLYTIYLIIIILFIFHLRTLLLPLLKLICLRKGVYGVSEGGDNKGGRLGIRGGLRPCCTPAFEYMELILASGTLKNFRFLLRSCLSTDRVPVITLTCSTFQSWHCITVLMTLRRDAYWFSDVLLTLMRYRSQTSDILLCSEIQKIPVVLSTGGRTSFVKNKRCRNGSLLFPYFKIIGTKDYVTSPRAWTCDFLLPFYFISLSPCGGG
jgi:hypothetical protein